METILSHHQAIDIQKNFDNQDIQTRVSDMFKLLEKNIYDLSDLNAHQDRVLEILLNSDVCFEQLFKIIDNCSQFQIKTRQYLNLKKCCEYFRPLTNSIYRWIQHFCFSKINKKTVETQNNSTDLKNQIRCHNCKNNIQNMKIRQIKECIYNKNLSGLRSGLCSNEFDHFFQDDQLGIDYNDKFWQKVQRQEYQQNKNSLYPKAESYIVHMIEQQRLKKKCRMNQIKDLEDQHQADLKFGTMKDQQGFSEEKINQIFQQFLQKVRKSLGKQSIMIRIKKLCDILGKMLCSQNEKQQQQKIQTECVTKKSHHRMNSENPDFKIVPKPNEVKQRELIFGISQDNALKNEIRWQFLQKKHENKKNHHRNSIQDIYKIQKSQKDYESDNQSDISLDKFQQSNFSSSKHNFESQSKKFIQIHKRQGKTNGIANHQNRNNKSKIRKREKIETKSVLKKIQKDNTISKQIQSRQQGIQCNLLPSEQTNKKIEVEKKNLRIIKKSESVDKLSQKIMNKSINQKKLSEKKILGGLKIAHKNIRKNASMIQKSNKRNSQQKLIQNFNNKINKSGNQDSDHNISLPSQPFIDHAKIISNKMIKCKYPELPVNNSISLVSIITKKEAPTFQNINDNETSMKQINFNKKADTFKKKQNYLQNKTMTEFKQKVSCLNVSISNRSQLDIHYENKNAEFLKKLQIIKQKENHPSFKCLNSNERKRNKFKNQSQNVFTLKDVQLFGGLSQAFAFEKNIFNQNSSLYRCIFYDSSSSNQQMQNKFQIIKEHFVNLSKFKSKIFATILSFLCKPYQTISQKAIVNYTIDIKQNCENIAYTQEQNTQIRNQLDVINKIIRFLMKKHALECKSFECIHILSFFSKICL